MAAQPQGDLSKIERDGQIGILLANGQFTDGDVAKTFRGRLMPDQHAR